MMSSAKIFMVASMLFASTAVGFNMEVNMRSSLTFDAEAAKNRPVSKVITLLKDMLKQLEKEAEEDEEIYDKMACWCETNDKEKTKAIADAEARISDLTTKIEELTAMSARLNTEIKNLEKEVAENQAALDKATAIREKQLAEFNEEEKDALEAISALKAAITVLSKHNSFLQIPKSHIAGVAASVQNQMQKHASLLAGVLTHAERRVIASFVQSPEDYFDEAPTFKQSYAPQSGEIFGILKQMKETFENNLSASQKEEMANQKAYEDLKAAKEDEIAAGQAQIDKKTQELADTDEKNAQAKEDVEDTKKTLSADEQFLMMLKEKCSMTDAEWEERQKNSST
jgi:chromosome segregation ATPase